MHGALDADTGAALFFAFFFFFLPPAPPPGRVLSFGATARAGAITSGVAAASAVSATGSGEGWSCASGVAWSVAVSAVVSAAFPASAVGAVGAPSAFAVGAVDASASASTVSCTVGVSSSCALKCAGASSHCGGDGAGSSSHCGEGACSCALSGNTLCALLSLVPVALTIPESSFCGELLAALCGRSHSINATQRVMSTPLLCTMSTHTCM